VDCYRNAAQGAHGDVGVFQAGRQPTKARGGVHFGIDKSPREGIV